MKIQKRLFSIGKSKIGDFDKTTVWYKFSRLAQQTESANLGQGFPDWECPDFYYESLERNMTNKKANHQYTRAFGAMNLCNSIAKNYSDPLKHKIDAESEVIVTTGAVGALYNTITSLIELGDEAVVIEPFYDCYLPQIQFAGGKTVGVPLIPPKSVDKSKYKTIKEGKNEDIWKFDFEAFKKALNDKTKLVILNTPHNPTGKVMTYEELKEVAKILKDYPKIIVIMDEVYEHMIFEDYEKLPRFATLPGMFERTVSIMSAGKIFSATGVRVGWAIAPKNLIKRINAVSQFNSFCIYEPLQSTIADCLNKANEPYKGKSNYYSWLKLHYLERRNYLMQGLSNLKNYDINFWLPEGGYFVVGDISNKNVETKYKFDDDTEGEKYLKDFRYLLNLAHDKKVVGIPCSVFYTPEHKHLGENFIRFASCKKDDTINRAFANLEKH